MQFVLVGHQRFGDDLVRFMLCQHGRMQEYPGIAWDEGEKPALFTSKQVQEIKTGPNPPEGDVAFLPAIEFENTGVLYGVALEEHNAKQPQTDVKPQDKASE